MKRRDFIRNVSLAASAVTLSQDLFPAKSAEKTKKNKYFVGAHVWVYAATQPGYDVSPVLDRIFSDMSYAGFDGVETMEKPLRSTVYTKQIMELTEKYKIKLLGTSYSADMWNREKHNEIYGEVDMILTNLSSAGGRTFGVSVGKPAGRIKTEEELDNQALLLTRLIDLCNKNGIVLNLHNHTYEVENNMHDLRGTLKRIPDVKLGPDVNWLLRGGVDPVAFMKEFRNQIVFLHLRDQLSNGKWPESLGEGNVDFRELAGVMNETGFSGDVVVELAHESGFTPTRPLKESLKMSREYLKKTMKI